MTDDRMRLDALLKLDKKQLQHTQLMNKTAPYPFRPELFMIAALHRVMAERTSAAVAAWFIGGGAVVLGLVSQVVPWEESDIESAHRAGWWLLGGGAVVVAIGIAVYSSTSALARAIHDLLLEIGLDG